MDRARYDTIGLTYSSTRREDRRIAAQINAALGDARSVINVGAGTGNYEPRDRPVLPVEPSATMIEQRRQQGRAPAARAVAERLPCRDGAFDAALAVLTMHHWTDIEAGASEMRRVADRQVVFFFEPAVSHSFWALDYWPEAMELPSEQVAVGEARMRALFDVRDVRVVPVPWDCVDGFGAAFWRRPEEYLRPEVQAGTSWLALLPRDVLRHGADRLAEDLRTGAWDDRHGHLRAHAEYDWGYRIAIAGD